MHIYELQIEGCLRIDSSDETVSDPNSSIVTKIYSDDNFRDIVNINRRTEDDRTFIIPVEFRYEYIIEPSMNNDGKYETRITVGDDNIIYVHPLVLHDDSEVYIGTRIYNHDDDIEISGGDMVSGSSWIVTNGNTIVFDFGDRYTGCLVKSVVKLVDTNPEI